ncbi:MAG TPA: hypothetical protein VFK80_00955 [Limnochordia bacterium]|nr:hypothetical protein [Limnochordia bacterium]
MGTRKFISLALALALVFTLTGLAFAQTPTAPTSASVPSLSLLPQGDEAAVLAQSDLEQVNGEFLGPVFACIAIPACSAAVVAVVRWAAPKIATGLVTGAAAAAGRQIAHHYFGW